MRSTNSPKPWRTTTAATSRKRATSRTATPKIDVFFSRAARGGSLRATLSGAFCGSFGGGGMLRSADGLGGGGVLLCAVIGEGSEPDEEALRVLDAGAVSFSSLP
jgi:hypothetical protein